MCSRWVLIVFASAALAWGCEQGGGDEEAAAEPARAGAPSAPEAPPEAPLRVVTLGGTASELAFALGHGDEVVGVDASSSYPEQVSELPQLGYFRKISAEGVLALRPTLVLAQEGTGPASALAQIEGAGVRVEIVPAAEDVDGAIARIEWMGERLGEEDRAAELVGALRADLERAEARRAAAKRRPKALFIYARGPNMVNVMGEGTSAAKMLELAGIEAAVGVKGFKPLTPEAVVAASPELLVMPTKGAQSLGGEGGVFGLPGVAQTPAGQARALVLVDDLEMLGFGPRFGQALLELQEKAGVVEGGDAPTR